MDLAWLAAVEAVCVLLLVESELRHRRVGRYVWKVLASATFVAFAVMAGAFDSRYGVAILAALALSFVGDVLLVSANPRVFRAGIGVFLLAHVGFIAAFLLRGPAWTAALASLVVLAPAALAVAAWLLPRVPTALRASVVAYMVVISSMVAVACGASAGDGPRWLFLAAMAFYLNDLAVARERFVKQARWHRAVGLPLYYAAQLAFAWSVLARAA